MVTPPRNLSAVRPLKVRHPILEGVKPWSFREEMYSRYFLFDNPGRTELLQATPANAAKKPRIVRCERAKRGAAARGAAATFGEFVSDTSADVRNRSLS